MKKLIEKINCYERLMRLDKPIGILLLLWPTLWALWIAAHGHLNWWIVAIFVLGSVLMRSAGCVLNDIADQKFDGAVARTQNRPLITGEVSVNEAIYLILFLLLLAFGLVTFLNIETILMSIPALFLAVSYPYTKRFLSIPQAYLGLAFSFGILMAFMAISQTIPSFAWWLLATNIFWTIAYDTEYAMVDREDDLKIGIKSSAILFGKYDVPAIMMCYSAMLVCLTMLGHALSMGYYYYGGLVLACVFAGYHYSLIKNRDPRLCFKAFLNNSYLGAAIFIGILMHYNVKNIF